MVVAPKETSFADSGEVKGGNITGKPGSGSSLCRSSFPFLQQLLPTLWQFFWRAVLPHCREIRRIRRCALQFFPACFSRLRFLRHRLKNEAQDERRESGRARLLPSQILSANREINKSASRETAANSDWRMLKQQRVANGFSGGQCSCTAEKFLCLTIAPYTQHSNFGSPGRFALPNAERIRRSEKSVKSHVPCPVPLVPHWLKPVALCTLARLHACNAGS